MKTATVKKRIVFGICGVSAALAGSVVIAAEQQTAKDTEAISTTLRQFYAATSKVDKQALKSTVDWPLMLVETDNKGTKKQFVYSEESEFDDLAKQAKQGPPPVKLSDIKVQFLNDGLASVTYECSVPSAAVSKTETAPARTLSLVTVLRKQENWKIIFTSIPS